ncbi:MAG: type IV pilus assembly protein PilM [Candidatus Margulisiibacteriota bacterium]
MFGFGKKKYTVRNGAIGVNISAHVINIIELLREGDKKIVESYNSIEIPADLDKDRAETFIIESLKKLFSDVKSKKTGVFSLISGSEVIIRRIQVPKIGKKELLEAIKWEIKTHLPFPVETAVINFSVLDETKSKEATKLNLLVAAVQKTSVDRTRGLFEKAGIRLEGLSIAPFAVWNLLKGTSILKKDKRTAFIDVGSENTKIVFFDGENLEFYRELSIGGIHFTKSMIGLFVSDKWQMNLNFEQAEAMKRRYGIPEEGTSDLTEDGLPLKQIYQVMRPTLRRFLNEVERSFGYYKEQFSKTSIDRVVLAGGASKMKNLDSHLSTELGINIEKIEDLIKVEKGPLIKDGDLLIKTIPHIAIAMGAALSQAKEMNFIGKTRSRFSRDDGEKTESILSKISLPKNFYTAAVISVFVIFIATLAALNISLDKSIAGYRKFIDEQKTLLANLKTLSEKQEILSKVEKQKVPIRPAIAELTNLLPKNSFLDAFSFNNASKGISITGISANMYLVGDLLKKLGSSGFFSDTALVEARKAADKKSVGFSMNFRLKL